MWTFIRHNSLVSQLYWDGTFPYWWVGLIALVGILIVSALLHEFGHILVSAWQGDPTTKLTGRLDDMATDATGLMKVLFKLDALARLVIRQFDPLGLLVMLISLALTGLPLGWLKPIEINHRFLKKRRSYRPLIWVALAGPLVNIIIAAICFGLIFVFAQTNPTLATVMVICVRFNVALAVVNLMPLPPLDGFRVVQAIIPALLRQKAEYKIAIASLVFQIAFVGIIFVPKVIKLFQK